MSKLFVIVAVSFVLISCVLWRKPESTEKGRGFNQSKWGEIKWQKE